MKVKHLGAIAILFLATIVFAKKTPSTKPESDGVKHDTVLVDTVQKIVSALVVPPPIPQCTLSLTTTPSEAAIYLNDSLVGNSPLIFSAPCSDSPVGLVIKKKGCYLKGASRAHLTLFCVIEKQAGHPWRPGVRTGHG